MNPAILTAAVDSANPAAIERLLDRPADLLEDRAGVKLYWSAFAVRVDAARLRAAIARWIPGLETAFREQACEPLVAMRRSIRRRQGAQATIARSSFWRETHHDAQVGSMTVAFAGETGLDGSGPYAAAEELAVEVDLKTGNVTVGAVSTVEQQEAVDALLARYDLERSTLTAEDVTGALARALVGRLGAHCVRFGGGVYFLPAGRDRVAPLLAAAFAEIDCGVRIDFDEVMPRTAGQMRAEVTASLSDIASKLCSKCEARLVAATSAAAGERKAPSWDSLIERQAEIDAAVMEAKLLRRLVGAVTEDIEATLAACEVATVKALDVLKSMP